MDDTRARRRVGPVAWHAICVVREPLASDVALLLQPHHLLLHERALPARVQTGHYLLPSISSTIIIVCYQAHVQQLSSFTTMYKIGVRPENSAKRLQSLRG